MGRLCSDLSRGVGVIVFAARGRVVILVNFVWIILFGFCLLRCMKAVDKFLLKFAYMDKRRHEL